jgi:DNA recombination-dependent growth factor C
MALLTGTIRIRRYEVSGALPGDLRNDFYEKIKSHGFEDFAENDPREEAVGWVAVDDIFLSGPTPDRWLIGDTINLSMRIDVRRIPGVIFKRECELLEKSIKEREGREKLSRHERQEVKEIIKQKLSARALPTIRSIEMSWDLGKGEVYLFACSENVSGTFQTLFEKTFNVKLRPLFPFALALRATGDEKGLAGVISSQFAPSR